MKNYWLDYEHRDSGEMVLGIEDDKGFFIYFETPKGDDHTELWRAAQEIVDALNFVETEKKRLTKGYMG